jgi:hypothetical protein
MTWASPAAARSAVIALLVIAALAFVALRAPFLSVPFERDEGEYAYIAQRMLAGDVPYRDAFDQKPPGVFVAYLLAFAAFGPSVESVHALLWIFTALAAAAFHRLVRSLAGALAAGFALIVFALASADPQVQGHAANTENFMLLPLVAAALFCVRGWQRGGRASWLACGACAALACWFKQVAASDALLLAAAVGGDAIVGRPRPGAREAAARAGLFALGALLASAPGLLYFAASGAGREFLDAVLLHNLAYSSANDFGTGLENLASALARQLPSFASIWLLATIGWLAPGRVPVRVRHALAAWWVASFAGAALGLHFRPHYFIQTVPALAALAGIGAATLAERLAQWRPARASWIAAALAALLLAIPVFAHRALLFAGSPDLISRRFYGLNPFPESQAIAAHIREHSAADDRVFIVGSEPQILFHAQRRSATRYIFFYPLTGDYPDARARQQQAVGEFDAARPLYVVWVELPTSHLRAERSDSFVYDAIAARIAQGYTLELVARLDDHDPTYVLERGAQAQRWRQEVIAGRREALLWIAVYRRTP